MDEEPIGIESYIILNKCKCCLGDGQLKDLWREYCEGGYKEIYGKMLNDCFNLNLCVQCNTDTQYTEKICESCVRRLRDALEFKQELVACGQLQYECFNNGLRISKEEIEEYDDDGEYLEENPLSENDPDSGCYKDLDYENVEYLEVDEEDVTEAKATDSTDSQSISQVKDTNASKHKQRMALDIGKRIGPQKKKNKELKLNRYKQYTREDMVKAIATVQAGVLNTREAAREFSVPRKTLATKLLLAVQLKDESDNEIRNKIQNKENHYKFIDEVKKILTYTNAVPFKTKASRYFCTYCSTDGPCFEDADELRAHTRTEHVDGKARNIEIVLRPQFQNEVIKMDINSLHCTVCCTIISTWTNMFKHLEETHNIELDQAYTKVIPYILNRDLKCALCSESFPNYRHLDSHMNSHYTSYVCSECGDTFLSAMRLTRHLKMHKTGLFPCEACGKVFARDMYRQKHFVYVHKQELNVKCVYCSERFHNTFQRHLHMVEKHKEKVRITICELCGMEFKWRSYYVAHMRKKHKIRTM